MSPGVPNNTENKDTKNFKFKDKKSRKKNYLRKKNYKFEYHKTHLLSQHRRKSSSSAVEFSRVKISYNNDTLEKEIKNSVNTRTIDENCTEPHYPYRGWAVRIRALRNVARVSCYF